ncbi:MAG: hypothetical protein V3T74_13705 [Gemmatimonadales bacterium]|jgi:hypothetical protein
MRIVSRIALTVVLVAMVATPAMAQRATWQNRWYWDGQVSLMRYKTPTETNWQNAYGVGGSWFITKRQGGLYLAFDQMFYDSATSLVPNGLSPTGTAEVTWEASQRWQAIIYAIPASGTFELYLGGGFAIHNIRGVDTTNAGTPSAQELSVTLQEIQKRSSRAFLILAGGLQLRVGRLAIFGDYQFMPASNQFLITSSQHVFTAGLRIALASSSTEMTTGRP